MRGARTTVPGLVHHVISRFVDRDWFFSEARERAKYLDYLGPALAESSWRCLAFALMSNHVHLAVVAGSEPPERWLKRTNSAFAIWMNRRRNRLGPMFAGRPAIWTVRPEHEPRLIAYIHNNPVRAAVTTHARNTPWTSHAMYCGIATAPPWLHVHEGLARCGFTPDQVNEFDRWVDGEHGEIAENGEWLADIRREARSRGAVELGTPLAVPEIRVPIVARPYARIWIDAAQLVARVAHVTGISAASFCSRSHKPKLVSARRITVHAASTAGLPMGAVASTLGISPPAVTKLARTPVSASEAKLIAAILAAEESIES